MLTHVDMWKNGKWSRITAEEAATLFPFSVSVNQKVFVCALCGNYVTLTGPGAKKRHFKHSRGDEDKHCEERSIGYENTPLQKTDRGLPIVIQVDDSKCEFLIRFPALSDDILNTMQEEHIILRYSGQSIKYNIERFRSNRSTYFHVGSQLAKQYKVSYSSKLLKDRCDCPEITEGFAENGRLFDSTTGKMLPFDADVIVGRHYFYYTRTYMSGTKTPYVNRLMNLKNGYFLYEVMPTALDQRNAAFFLSLRARLTNTPLSVQTIWPPVRQIDDTIIHQKRYVRALLYGAAKVSLNDTLLKPIGSDENGAWSLYRISTGEESANVLIGRSRILQDNQYLHSAYTAENGAPCVEIRDIHNEIVETDRSSSPPPRNRLRVKFQYDGYLCIYKDDQYFSLLEVPAERETEVNNIVRGTRIQCYIGNELEREYAVSKPVKQTNTLDEDVIYHTLLRSKGEKVAVSHAVKGELARRYKDHRIRAWIRQQGNAVPKDALEFLVSSKK